MSMFCNIMISYFK